MLRLGRGCVFFVVELCLGLVLKGAWTKWEWEWEWEWARARA